MISVIELDDLSLGYITRHLETEHSKIDIVEAFNEMLRDCDDDLIILLEKYL